MAYDFTALNTITQDYIVPKIQDNVFSATPLLDKLKGTMQEYRKGGVQILQPIITAKNTAITRYSGRDALLTTAGDYYNAVSYNWGHYNATMSVAKTDTLKNSGKEQIINLLTIQGQVAEKSLADALATDLMSATAVTNGVGSIPMMVGTTDEFGGISSSDASIWASSVDTSTTSIMTLGALQGKFGDVTDGMDRPNLIVSNQDCFDKLWQLYEVKPEFRVQGENGSLKFNGAEWIVDSYTPGSGSGTADNDIYFLNTKYIILYVHPDDNFSMGKWQELIDQNVNVAKLGWSGQLTTSNRRRHGAFKGINPAL